MTLAGRVFSNRYEIQRELAQGGMAEVYLARDQLLSRPVALKALFPEYAREPSFVERFRREAQAAANLNHPNIVAIYDWGQEDGTYFIVMEYVEGRSLRDLIRSEAPLEAIQAADITAEIASALAFAHRGGVVHRDVKPGNVLLTRSGTVKVTDFGIARSGVSDGLTQTGSVMGTATYFSPEQAQGLPVDGRSDVYALGVVLYEMVTGGAPFTGDSPVSVAYKHVREDPPPPSDKNPDLPPDLQQIILTAMAKDADHRYQTADDMRADLLRFRRGRPLAAAPVTALVAEVPTTTAAAQSAYAATMATPKVDDRGRQVSGATYAQKKKRSPWVTAAVIIGLAALVALILVAATKMGSSAQHVDVPNVVGKPASTAQSDLERAGLEVSIKEVANANVEPKEVIKQSPAAGDSVTRGSTVTLTVSKGVKQVEIPLNIVGMGVVEATETLTDLGFTVGQEPQPSDTVDKDKVIDSDPKPGTSADEGETIDLIISSGPAPIPVPQVQNLTQAAAVQVLRENGFLNVLPQFEANETVSEDLVIRTTPAAGTEATTDTPVTLVISSGPPTVRVPNVVGLTTSAANTQLSAVGLKSRVVEELSTAGNVGKVIRQEQSGEVEPGSTIVLHIGVSTPPVSNGGNNNTTTTEP